MKTQEIDIRNLSREERGKLIFERCRIAKKNDYWVVDSQTSFKVALKASLWSRRKYNMKIKNLKKQRFKKQVWFLIMRC